MKLYFYDFYGGEIKTRSEEYEEKSKTYASKGETWTHYIKKTAIGEYGADFHAELILTEYDIERAKEIFIAQKKWDIHERESDIEYQKRKIKELREEIENLKEIKIASKEDE